MTVTSRIRYRYIILLFLVVRLLMSLPWRLEEALGVGQRLRGGAEVGNATVVQHHDSIDREGEKDREIYILASKILDDREWKLYNSMFVLLVAVDDCMKSVRNCKHR